MAAAVEGFPAIASGVVPNFEELGRWSRRLEYEVQQLRDAQTKFNFNTIAGHTAFVTAYERLTGSHFALYPALSSVFEEAERMLKACFDPRAFTVEERREQSQHADLPSSARLGEYMCHIPIQCTDATIEGNIDTNSCTTGIRGVSIACTTTAALDPNTLVCTVNGRGQRTVRCVDAFVNGAHTVNTSSAGPITVKVNDTAWTIDKPFIITVTRMLRLSESMDDSMLANGLQCMYERGVQPYAREIGIPVDVFTRRFEFLSIHLPTWTHEQIVNVLAIEMIIVRTFGMLGSVINNMR